MASHVSTLWMVGYVTVGVHYMEEVLTADRFDNHYVNRCVFCENGEYQKRDYDSLCYLHKRKLLWG